ncbi:pimeloyl-ACP methyl ester carboxylesterase [Stella humosa]|uniref:Pimeloyl-ACP methyl ester carboxylesterase n=1 Tax=Stella humosa TaxID=94 RepID=A0A3N1LWH9_9PROT|nr:alpha/beta hydrolase [Stella humosa]ROP99523.1 pimeloyl-ACP methyl ester carboxylesterase [Stella humosa]BBK31263.1 alpha/beta hydrolase [Stella humosa]
MLDDRYFDSAGVPIRYVEAGGGEPVILLHGFSSSLDEGWVERGVVDELARSHRVVAFDSRGHGKSGQPHDPAAYGPEMGRDAIRLMDHLGLPRAHVMGYSMGAHVAAQLVTRSPARFASLILGGAVGRLDWSEADQARVDIEAAELDQGLLSSQILRLWPKDQPVPSAGELKAISARRLAGKDPLALAAARRSNPEQVVTLADLAATPVPLLGIVGTADPYRKDFERLRTARPGMELVLIEGAAHGNAVGRPEYVAAVRGFLARQPPMAAA